MPRPVGIKLRVHRASGRFYKTIGVALGRDGKPKKKQWYFDPRDKAAAVLRCFELKTRWQELRRSGRSLWDEVEDDDDGSPLASKAAAPRPITVDDAAKLYLSHIEDRMLAGQVSRSHFESQRKRLTKALEPLVRTPLSVLGEAQLQAATLWMAQRPDVRNKPGTKVSAVFARAALNSLRWFLVWCDESETVEWKRPSRFKAIFKIRPVLSDEEQHRELEGHAEVDHFTLEELQKLWQQASDQQRCLMLLGLNCAFCSAECADFRVTEVSGLESATPVIERYRRKTIKTAGRRAYARWHLWPETVTYLVGNRADKDNENHWLRTEDGYAMTTHNAIGQGWRRLVSRAGVRRLGFKYVRKTAAHIVRIKLGYGSEVAKMLLAHADGGMLKYYAGRDWDGVLRDATMAMREHLTPMFAEMGGSEDQPPTE